MTRPDAPACEDSLFVAEFFARCPLRAAFVRDMKLRRYFAKRWIFWAKLILRVGRQRRQAIEHRGLSGCH